MTRFSRDLDEDWKNLDSPTLYADGKAGKLSAAKL